MAEFDLTAEIQEQLQAYTEEVAEEVDRAAEDCAKKLRADIRATSPKRTGDYSKGWRSKVTQNSGGYGNKVFTVYNAEKYQLTHLLEFGHAGRVGKLHLGPPRFVQGHPHIAPANDRWQEEFAERCAEVCKR